LALHGAHVYDVAPTPLADKVNVWLAQTEPTLKGSIIAKGGSITSTEAVVVPMQPFISVPLIV